MCVYIYSAVIFDGYLPKWYRVSSVFDAPCILIVAVIEKLSALTHNIRAPFTMKLLL